MYIYTVDNLKCYQKNCNSEKQIMKTLQEACGTRSPVSQTHYSLRPHQDPNTRPPKHTKTCTRCKLPYRFQTFCFHIWNTSNIFHVSSTRLRTHISQKFNTATLTCQKQRCTIPWSQVARETNFIHWRLTKYSCFLSKEIVSCHPPGN